MARGKGGGGGGGGGGGRGGYRGRPAPPALTRNSGSTRGRTPASKNGGESHNFSMKDEARNTGRDNLFRDADSQLRHKKIIFVSAGQLDPKKLIDLDDEDATEAPEPTVSHPEAAFADLRLQEVEVDDAVETAMSKEETGDAISDREEAEPSPPSSGEGESTQDLFVVDVMGSRSPIHHSLPPPVIRSPSPCASDSSEEVILFTGRRGGPSVQRKAKLPKSASQPGMKREELSGHEDALPGPRHQPTALQASIPARRPQHVRIIEDPPHAEGPTSLDQRLPLQEDSLPSRTRQQTRPKGSRHFHHARFLSRKQREEADLADYIANMREDDSTGASDEAQGGQGEQQGEPHNPDHDSAGSLPLPEDHSLASRHGWDPVALRDLDDISTSDDVEEAILDILSKRERPSGLQYLVVWEGETFDDARWIASTALTMTGAAEHILRFEEAEEALPHYPDDSAESSDLDLGGESDLNSDELEDMKDEQDLVERRITRMTDETLARLLAKQEELGMGSDELVLFDDDASVDDDLADLGGRRGTSKASTALKAKSKGKKPPKDGSASSAFLAEPYEGFDVMDWARPSLIKKPKGQKPSLPFDVSDSELEAALISSWAGDRSKKKMKKQEREELRAQGLLGVKHNEQAKLKAKYTEGMTLDEIKNEIKKFLMSSHGTLPLPPMDKGDRKIVHEIANAFKLKSKSVGAGTSRSPILYKTARSGAYDESDVNAIERQLRQRRFLPRKDRKAGKGGPASKRNGGGFNSAAVSYRDGEVVGAAAPELGAENRGRAMLEKMGWSTGTALGALDNKGILQPVAHVVKISKAGLG